MIVVFGWAVLELVGGENRGGLSVDFVKSCV